MGTGPDNVGVFTRFFFLLRILKPLQKLVESLSVYRFTRARGPVAALQCIVGLIRKSMTY